MNDIIDFFKRLLDTSDWPPRWHCGKWTEFHGWLYITSDLLIWSAYFAIPVIILRYATKKSDIRFTRMYFLFAAFILACGSTHFMDAVMFWFPAYRLSALLRFITGVLSWITVFALIKNLPLAFSLKTPKELQTEIDTRKEVEEELKKKITQLTQAEKAAQFGYYEFDFTSGEIHLSDGMLRLFEIDNTNSVISLTDYLQFIPEEERADVVNILRLSEQEYKPRYQNIITAKKKKRILYLSGSKIFDQQKGHDTILGTAQDVTHTIQNQQKLDYNRQLFEAAFYYSSMGIALVKFDGNCIDVNTMACDILRYSKHEIMRTNFFSLIHPDDKEESLYNMQLLKTNQEQYHRSEKRLVRKDGKTIWSLFSKSIVWQANKEDSFFIFQFVDISKRILLMQELQQKNATLETSNRTLQYHVNQTSEFNHIIGHNLKGPAASLIQIAEHMDIMESVEEKDFMLGKVRDIAQNIMRTLEDMKDFIEVRLNSERDTKCAFQDIIDDSLSILELEIKRLNAQFNIHLNCEYVDFPLLYLKSIVFNLLSNALKYHKQDVEPVINISTYESNGSICLQISDNGIGINLQKYKNDIFKYRKIFHKGYDSYGLGLFLTKTQLEAFNGSISVESEPGNGTTFIAYFKKHDT